MATVFALTLLIAESINKDGMTFAFHLRTPKAGRWVRESPNSLVLNEQKIAQSVAMVTSSLAVTRGLVGPISSLRGDTQDSRTTGGATHTNCQ